MQNTRRMVFLLTLLFLIPVGTSAQTSACPQLSRMLQPGMSGADVSSLQQFLISQGLLAAGNDTGTYGPLTQQAVQNYQVAHGIVSSGTPGTTGFGAVGPSTRASIASVCAGGTSIATVSSSVGSPTISDYFNGTAHFQGVSEAESVTVSLTGALGVWDQELKVIKNPADNMYYAFTRIYIADNVFTMALVRSSDGKNFSTVGRLFNGVPGTFYDATVSIDTSVSPARGTMVMECAPAGIEHVGACISTSQNAFTPGSWSTPTLLIEGCDPDPSKGCNANRYMSASTPVVLNAGGATYVGWSVVDTKNPPFGTDIGDERVFTAGKQISGTGYSGYANSGTTLLPAEANIYCTSTWDCNNRNATDWLQADGSYLLVYAGGNYYGCSRSTGSVQWGIGIARSSSPLGHYEGRSTAAIMGIGPADACRITYPTLNIIGGETYLYFPYSVTGGNGNFARSKLVWNAPVQPASCTNGLSISTYPSCSCPAGQTQSGSQCVAPASCVNGLSITAYPSCSCPAGQTQNGSQCVTVSNACTNGLNRVQYPSCACPTGQTVSGTQCVNNQPVTSSTLNSVTSTTAFWQSLYSCVLGRSVSASDVAPWIALQGTSVNSYADAYRGFFNSSEYLARNTTNLVYVQQMYQCVLFRTPESSGVDGWISNMRNGTTRAQVLSGFVQSGEFQNSVQPYLSTHAPLTAPTQTPQSCANGLNITTYPNCSCPSGTAIANGQCQTIQPQSCSNGLSISSYPSCTCPSGQTQSGSQCVQQTAQTCQNGLNITSYPSCACPSNQTVSGTQCVAPALPGTQAQRTLFAGLYTCILGRSGSDSEITEWIQVHPSTPYAAFQGFYDSTEYRSKNTSDTSYVSSLYSCVLKRSDEAGVKAWVSLMQAGTTRSEVLSGFVNSQEFQSSQAGQMQGTLNATQASIKDLSQVASALAALQALLNLLKVQLGL